MTFRKLFVVGAAMAALGFAGAAIAQTSAQKAQIDQAKAAGVGGTPTVLMDGKNWAIDGAEDSFGDWASAKIEG